MKLTFGGVPTVLPPLEISDTFRGSPTGYNGFQKIGTGSLCLTKPRLLKHDQKFVQIALSEGLLATISTEGKLYIWGKSAYRLRGLKQKDYKPAIPLEIEVAEAGRKPEKVKQVKCGTDHVLILTDSKKIFSFGSNRYGQLGLASRSTFVPKISTDIFIRDQIKQISCGNDHSAALTCSGRLLIWGLNDAWQFGPGAFEDDKVMIPSEKSSRKILSVNCRGNKTALIWDNLECTIFGKESTEEGECVLVNRVLSL